MAQRSRAPAMLSHHGVQIPFARAAAIRAGVGIGFAPAFITTGDKTLQRLDVAFPEPPRGADLLVLVHVDMRKNARVRAFVDHVSTQLMAQRALFEGE